jgi:hypothetical protein
MINIFCKVPLDINPIENKLFSNDVFTVSDNKNVKILHSSIRSCQSIPGVLILSGNKTYGRITSTQIKSNHGKENQQENLRVYFHL